MPYDQQSGYIEQGYANTAVIPVEMQLNQVQQMRTSLAQSQSNLRRSNDEESERMNARAEMDNFVSFSADLADRGVEGQDRLKSVENYFDKNPRAAASQEIQNSLRSTESLRSMRRSESDDQLRMRNNAFDNKLLDESEKSFEQDITASQQAKKAEAMNVELRLDAVMKMKNDVQKSNEQAVSNNLYSATNNAKPEQRNATISLYSALNRSDNKADKEMAFSVYEAAESIKVSESMSKITRYRLDEMKPYMQGFASRYNVDPRGVYDPATREKTLTAMQEAAEKKGITDVEKESFDKFFSSVSEFSRLEKESEDMSSQFYDSITEIEGLRGAGDADSMKKYQSLLDNMNVRNRGVTSFVNAGYESIREKQVLEDRDLEVAKKQTDIRKSIVTLEGIPKRAKERELAATYEKQRDLIGDEKSWLIFDKAIFKDQLEDTYGVDPDMSIQERIAVYKKGSANSTIDKNNF